MKNLYRLPVLKLDFTFQSGYIQMKEATKKLLSCSNFTFQSGYIQIIFLTGCL